MKSFKTRSKWRCYNFYATLLLKMAIMEVEVGDMVVAIVVGALVEATEALIVAHQTMPVSTVELLHSTDTPTVHAIMHLQIVQARLLGTKISQQWTIAWAGQMLFVVNDGGRQNKG